MALIGWIITLALIPSNLFLMESCEAIGRTLTDPVFFNTTLQLLATNSTSLEKYLYTCIHGDQDLPKAIGLVEPTDYFNTFYNTSLKAAENLTEQSKVPFKSVTIPEHYDELESYRNGTVSDSTYTGTDLKTLDALPQPDTACQKIQDTWTLTSTTCPGDPYKALLADDFESFNVGYPTCMGFYDWLTGIPKEINNRYVTLEYMKDCMENDEDTVIADLKTYVTSFVKNRKSLMDLVSRMQTDLNYLATMFTNFMTFLNDFKKPANAINEGLSNIATTLFSTDNGLMTNMKCSILPKYLQYFHDNMCIGFIPTAFQISVVTMVFSIICTFTALSLFCLARRFMDPIICKFFFVS